LCLEAYTGSLKLGNFVVEWATW